LILSETNGVNYFSPSSSRTNLAFVECDRDNVSTNFVVVHKVLPSLGMSPETSDPVALIKVMTLLGSQRQTPGVSAKEKEGTLHPSILGKA
jgi:hypothetical protein